MPNPNAIVSLVVRLDPPLDRPAADRQRTVELADGRRVRLDPANPLSAGLAQVLDGAVKLRLPIYLEVDPATSDITRVILPTVGRVRSVRSLEPGVLGVELDRSHAIHLLRSTSPDFAEFEARLRDALRTRVPLVVTIDGRQEIIDVRAFTPAPEGPFPPFPEPEFPPLEPWPWRWLIDWLRRLWRWPWWPWWWFGCMSPGRAQQVFDAMKATSCNPLTVPPPCIPFMYPTDGCWARAHEMCRLMINMGVSPEKVWIQGWPLNTPTKNDPDCHVIWGWHVAPTVCVRGPWFLRQKMVIDPSLFTTPVTVPAWKAVQGNPNASLTYTAASDFRWGQLDPNYVQTNIDLATYRLALLNQSIQFGPPPYAQCP